MHLQEKLDFHFNGENSFLRQQAILASEKRDKRKRRTRAKLRKLKEQRELEQEQQEADINDDEQPDKHL